MFENLANTINTLVVVGIVLCIYMIFIRFRMKKSFDYKPMCDLSDRISCSAPMKSRYASLLGIDNDIVGLLFYIGLDILMKNQMYIYVFYGAVVASVVSVFLAYSMFFKLRVICPLCVMLYAVNFGIMIAAYKLAYMSVEVIVAF